MPEKIGPKLKGTLAEQMEGDVTVGSREWMSTLRAPFSRLAGPRADL
ncbi:MAG TPA: hypothetical protein VK919_02990 [Solirubrobacterales bacterium]|nr:hypothetical protein [Solirubrobacterales bacterium]